MGPLGPMTMVTLLRVTMAVMSLRSVLLLASLWSDAVTLVALPEVVLTFVEELRFEMSIPALARRLQFLVVTLVTGRIAAEFVMARARVDLEFE